MTTHEAVELGFLPGDIAAIFPKKELIVSYEFLQDMKSMFQFFPRTPDITEKDISEWKAADERLNSIDMAEAKKRVKVESSFVPYEDYGMSF